ncbi:MAG: beta-galactosidase small subunit-related protein, partial [Planctomycetota bacterium]
FLPKRLDPGDAKAQRHTVDVEAAIGSDPVTWRIDFKQSGVGGDNSWGAVPHREYTLWPQPLRYSFILRPLARSPHGGEGQDAAALARQVFHTPSMAWTAMGRSLEFDDFADENLVAHLARDASLVVRPGQSSRYSRHGDRGLVDGIRASIDRRGGDWQGFAGGRFEAIVDLGEAAVIRRLKVGFLENPGARIFFPRQVTYELAAEDGTFEQVWTGGTEAEPGSSGVARRYFTARVDSVRARRIRVRATGFAVCPEGHPRAGAPAWLYVDEVVVDGEP